MALTIMTPRWTQIANSITVYLLKMRLEGTVPADTSPTHIYNCWARHRGIAIDDEELAVWCVDFIARIMKMPLNRLKTAAEIDGLI